MPGYATASMDERAVPILPGDDLGEAKAFYVDRLGFAVEWEETEVWGGRTFGVTDPSGNLLFMIGPTRDSGPP